VTEPVVQDAAQVEDVAHLSLLVGRLLLLNGADTAQVEVAVERFAAAFGCEAHLMVSYEALLLTIVAGDHFRTKIGSRVPAMNVGMTAVEAVNRLVDAAASGRRGLAEARAALDAVEQRAPEYGRWLVVVALGLTAASLSRLFGGDWPTFAVTWLAGAVGTWLRLELGRRHLNPILIPFAAACLSGVIGGGAVLLGVSGAPALCLVAPGMIIVPGVPLINGVEDMLRNHMTLGISRLGFAGLVTTMIAFGLFVATVVTGVTIPVAEPARAIALPQDAVFSALAALGYAFLFNVPARMAWACVLCGVASHTTRTLFVHLGIDIIAGTLIGALAAGFLAQGFAVFPGAGRRLRLSRRGRHGARRLRLSRRPRQPADRARHGRPGAGGGDAGAGDHRRADGRGDRCRHRRPGASVRVIARLADDHLPARPGLNSAAHRQQRARLTRNNPGGALRTGEAARGRGDGLVGSQRGQSHRCQRAAA
jgi:uncharacterized membrane protein YjjP (DUF1212 family)